jgi:hypothetical protein
MTMGMNENIKDEKWGIFQRIIPEKNIPYDASCLFDGQIISTKGASIRYYKEWEGFRLVTDDPTDFLTNEQRLSEWRD